MCQVLNLTWDMRPRLSGHILPSHIYRGHFGPSRGKNVRDGSSCMVWKEQNTAFLMSSKHFRIPDASIWQVWEGKYVVLPQKKFTFSQTICTPTLEQAVKQNQGFHVYNFACPSSFTQTDNLMELVGHPDNTADEIYTELYFTSIIKSDFFHPRSVREIHPTC